MKNSKRRLHLLKRKLKRQKKLLKSLKKLLVVEVKLKQWKLMRNLELPKKKKKTQEKSELKRIIKQSLMMIKQQKDLLVSQWYS
jgi:hypothetical protein